MAFEKKTKYQIARKESLETNATLLRQLFNRVGEEMKDRIHKEHDIADRQNRLISVKFAEEELIKEIPKYLKLK